MGLFDIFKKGKKKVPEEKIALGMDRISQLMDKLKNESERKTVKITANMGSAGLFESKFGGYPYWEKGRKYPETDSGEKLVLLAQINLSDLPDIESPLPKKGLLQFYINTDDSYGMSFDGKKDGYKIIYYPEIKDALSIEELRALGIDALSDRKNLEAPFYEEYRLTFSVENDYPNEFDDAILTSNINEMFGIDIEPDKLYKKLSNEEYDAIYEATNPAGHKMLGYPFFTQWDPRNEGEYEILLLQIDSDFTTSSGNKIMWGDTGVANFFISSEDLENLDFDNVLYNWDCY